jgi:hypothetical protein
MFVLDHKMGYAAAWGLNGNSPSARSGKARDVLGLWGEVRGLLTRPTAAREREEPRLRFVVEHLDVPHTGRAPAEPGVLFVRLTAPTPAPDVLAVAPDAGRAIAAELAAGDVARVVLVGTDQLLSQRAAGAPGHDAAVAALVDVLLALATARVPFTWRTRGGLAAHLPAALASAIETAAPHGTLEVGLATLDAELCAALEGRAGAHPEERLRLATAVSSHGMPVRALLDPLVPMLTDQQATLEPLLHKLADAGVHRVAARYLVLTRARARALARRLTRMQRALIEGCFAHEAWQPAVTEGDSSSLREVHKLLPPNLRRRGHHRLEEAGAKVGILVDVLDPVTDAEVAALADTEPAAPPPAKRPQLDLFGAAKKRSG